ncbi:trypsin beta-like [Aphomia sociella]
MGKFVYLLSLAFACSYAGPLELSDTSSLSNRILNGQNATNQQFLHAVSIQRISEISTPGRGHVCGGVLITLQHVLTAASCTYSINYANGRQVIPILANEFRVFAGSAILTNDSSADRIRNIANYTVHPDHIIEPSNVNDIAVITLVSPFLSTVVTPLSLPSTNYNPSDFTQCTVAGWGGTTSGSTTPSTQLQYIHKYTYNQNLCMSVYNKMPNALNILPSMLCAATYDVLAAGCAGDHGNALVCNGTLAGIAFMPADCLNDWSAHPEVYTRVSNYTTWIRSVTGSAPTLKPGFMALIVLTVLHAALQKVVS